MAKDQGPTARQRKLASELRKLRREAGFTTDDATAALGWQKSKLNRVETGTTTPTVADVGRILGAYGGIDHARRLAFLELTRQIRQRGWWVPFGEIFSGSYAELEDAADRILSLEKEGIPGLLQTPDYARELISQVSPSPQETDLRLQARLTRQAILLREKAPKLCAVLTEEVLHRPIGGPTVMRRQLQRLLEEAERPNVELRVIPTERAHYPTFGEGGMVIFEFDSPIELDTVYVETVPGGHYIEDSGQVHRCKVVYAQVAEAALSPEDSAALITAISKE
ncbi:helix-turn-helix transcriptional regulator [Actinocorallia sp. A-T 12471]|uniref:helix-turn-helix domain-containing protein n=1 Tax=Actinocorallia sp. A-T 12471 TaxID=3089813 RepID=UPI0029D311BA|nr:helix-turn-helix transcriptional regulator [Actinocorallia sp. A-T 12471]MDX6742690.1 helix-turn-helix transcriptional regulator [Actinocorallia sp. A-T 12471]